MTTSLIDEFERFRLAKISDIKPSNWVEKNRVMTSDVSPFPGPFRYDKTPYTREIIDCISSEHPSRIIAVMKAAQIGFTASVIEGAIGWIIDQNPGNIMFLSGAQELSEEVMNKRIDQMIESAGLRHLIRPGVIKKKNQRTGDTAKAKEFPGGSLVAGSASNDRLLRQRSIQFGFIDDFDAVKRSSKAAGSIRKLIEARFAAFYEKMKLYYISTPEVKQKSNIEPVFLLGDQRRFYIPCPCCGQYIAIFWNVERPDMEPAGITWKLEEGKLVSGSVGYICQECGGFFNDRKKLDLMRLGEWRPTAEPSEPGYYSYHISALYAPPGMYDWEYYVRQWLEANPPAQKAKEDLVQTFYNLVLGETYEQKAKQLDATSIQKNIRNYKIGEIPEWVSHKDGNGDIVMITLACDLNGVEQDARVDYEMVAWSENGTSYSIRHGSIGTFVPKEGSKRFKDDRQHWTYELGRTWSVWPELKKIIEASYLTDTERKMKIVVTGIDTGHYTNFAFEFIDSMPFNVIGLKGDKESKFRRLGIDVPIFKEARERSKLYLLDVNHVKDTVSTNMELKWSPNNGEQQPTGFMNYPIPSEGLYLLNNYFSHFQAEHRIIESKEGEAIGSRWVKKHSQDQNHAWDCYIYSYCLRDLWANKVLKEAGEKNGSWADFVRFFKDLKNKK